jgi:hypothetical protein
MDKSKLLLYISIAFGIVIIYAFIISILFFTQKNISPDSIFYKARVDTLESEIKVLTKGIEARDYSNAIDKKAIVLTNLKNDSLLNVILKTPIKYVDSYKKIDNASANQLINEFNNVFTNNSIK